MTRAFHFRTLTKVAWMFTRFFKLDIDNNVLKQVDNDLGYEYKYKTWYFDFDISCYVQGPNGEGGVIAETGMAGDTANPGTTLGSWIFDATADTVTFSIQVPDDWCNDGQADSLILQLYGKSTTQINGLDVIIYPKTGTTALVTDVVEIPLTALGWATFTTLSSGIGDKALQPGDIIDIVISPDTDFQTTELERIRWKYKPGIKLQA